MKSRLKLLGEMIVVTMVIVTIIYYSNWIGSLFGYTSWIRLFLICLIPVLMMVVPGICCKVTRTSMEELGYHKKNIKQQMIVVVAVLMIWLIVTVVIPLGFGIPLSSLVGRPYYEMKILIFRLIYYIFFVGFSEEFIFRGYYYQRLKKLFNHEGIAIVGSSILFGGMHYITSGNALLVLETFFAGVLFSLCAHKCKWGSVWATSLSHGLYDASLVLIASFCL